MKKSKNSLFKVFFRMYIFITLCSGPFLTEGTTICANVFSVLRAELNLPILVASVLHKEGIRTVKKLLSKTPEELLKLPNFSENSLKEVEMALARKDLSLKGAAPISSLNLSSRVLNVLFVAGINTVEELVSKTEQELLKESGFGKHALSEVKTALAKKNLSLRELFIETGFKKALSYGESLSVLGLSVRVESLLNRNDIDTVEKLINKTSEELLGLIGFGQGTLKQINRALSKRDLSLKRSSIAVKSERDLLWGVISVSDLSAKTKNILLAQGIETVGILLSKTEEELMSLPNFGKTSLQEVREFLAKKDLSLKKISSDLRSIFSLDLSARTQNVLRAEGINTVKELVSKTEEELMWIPHFGKKGLKEVQEALSKRDLSLSKADSDWDSVYSLGLSSYTLTILRAEGIKTIEELANKTERELMQISYFRIRALQEVKMALARKGLFLRNVSF